MVSHENEEQPSRQECSIADRQHAYFFDLLLWLLIGRVLFDWSGLQDYLSDHLAADVNRVYAICSLFGWRVLFLCKDAGFSPGKRLYGLRVVDSTTLLPIGVLRSVRRNAILLLPFVGELIILAQMSFGRRWFDGLVHCTVIQVSDE